MGNLLNKQKFTIKNKTEFEIHFYLSEHKLDLDITDIQPGPMGEARRGLQEVVGGKVYKSLKRMKEKAVGPGGLRSPAEAQRDRVVLDLIPAERGFRAVAAGGRLASTKLAVTADRAEKLYLTVLTRQFLVQGSLSRNARDHERIDTNPVNRNSYNVPLYNHKLASTPPIRGVSIDLLLENGEKRITPTLLLKKIKARSEKSD